MNDIVYSWAIMIDSLLGLFLATAAFIITHLALSGRPLRDRLVGKMGAQPFLGFYAVAVAIPFAWMIMAYNGAPHVEIWRAPTAVKHLSLTLMIIVCIFLAASFTPRNPTLAGTGDDGMDSGPRGIFRITRHPMMWGIGVWALLHVAANGDGAAIILFGGLAGLALLGPLHIDRRRARTLGDKWRRYQEQSSHIPFAAILAKRTTFSAREIGWPPVIIGFILYLVLLIAHEPVIGTAPVSLVSGIFK